jgi:hypothetical protein
MTKSHSKIRFLFNFYSLLDLCCFTGVAYFSFFHANFSPKDTYYNFYLLQGPFRFLRLRRALKSLDKPMKRSSALYKLGPFIVSKLTALLMLFTARVFLFLMSAAALVLAVEFPCEAFAPCSLELQHFHLCIYFVVISISTVGYGDIVCVTDIGRILMIFVVIGALVRVPKEMAEYNRVERVVRRSKEKAKRNGEQIHNSYSRNESLEASSDSSNNSDQDDDNEDSDKDSEFESPKARFTKFQYPLSNQERPKMSSIPEEKESLDSRSLPPLRSSIELSTIPASMALFDSQNVEPLAIWAELQLLRLHDESFIHKLATSLDIRIDSNDVPREIIRKLFIRKRA